MRHLTENEIFPNETRSLEILKDLQQDVHIQNAKRHRTWNGIADQIVSFTHYIRVAEHSAGLSKEERETVERDHNDAF